MLPQPQLSEEQKKFLFQSYEEATIKKGPPLSEKAKALLMKLMPDYPASEEDRIKYDAWRDERSAKLLETYAMPENGPIGPVPKMNAYLK